MKKQDLHKLSIESLNLRVLDVTHGINGYPESTEYAVAGFKTFAEAEDFAEDHNLTVVPLHKKDGCGLWEEAGISYGPLKITAEDYGSDFFIYNDIDEFDDFANDLVKETVDNFGLEATADVIKDLVTIRDSIESLEEGQMAVVHDLQVFEILPKEIMYWSYDSNTYAIGLI